MLTFPAALLPSFWLIIGLLSLTNALGQVLPDSISAAMYVQPTADFALNGDGKEQEWKAGKWLILPQRTGKTTYTTRVKLLYSMKGIYCLFDCDDRKITATLTEDFTDLYNEDVVELFLWPKKELPVYLEYELSPLNKELLILVPNFDNDFYGWRPWHFEGNRTTRHATHIHKATSGSSWTAEVFIPFPVMKPLVQGIPKKGDQWRANIYRMDYDNGMASWEWKKTDKTFHEFAKFGTIIFN